MGPLTVTTTYGAGLPTRRTSSFHSGNATYTNTTYAGGGRRNYRNSKAISGGALLLTGLGFLLLWIYGFIQQYRFPWMELSLTLGGIALSILALWFGFKILQVIWQFLGGIYLGLTSDRN
jgi:hypothetical protein